MQAEKIKRKETNATEKKLKKIYSWKHPKLN